MPKTNKNYKFGKIHMGAKQTKKYNKEKEKKMTITPLFDRVLIEEEKQEPQTTTGFLLSQSGAENVIIATVVATGNGNEKENGEQTKMFVKPGNKILCSKFAVTMFKHKNKEYGILRQNDVLAILK